MTFLKIKYYKSIENFSIIKEHLKYKEMSDNFPFNIDIEKNINFIIIYMDT